MNRRRPIAHHVDDWQQLLDTVSPHTFTASRLTLPSPDQAPRQPEEAWPDEEILNSASRIIGGATQQKGDSHGPEAHVHR